MNTAVATRPNVLKKDINNNWYSLPEGMVDTFVQINETIQNADMFSHEWNQAIDDLNEMFGDSRVED